MSIIVVQFFLTSMNIIGSGRFCSRSENLVCSTCIRNFRSVSLWYLNWLPSEEYVLIDKMGGPNGKVLGSFFYDERTRRSLILVSWTRAKYFLIRPDSTHSISVLWPLQFLFPLLFPWVASCWAVRLFPELLTSLRIAGPNIGIYFWSFSMKKCAHSRTCTCHKKKMPLEIIRS